MRLLNTNTLQLSEFVQDIPPYAILSHRWGDEEVTFQDIRARPDLNGTIERPAERHYESAVAGASHGIRQADVPYRGLSSACVSPVGWNSISHIPRFQGASSDKYHDNLSNISVAEEEQNVTITHNPWRSAAARKGFSKVKQFCNRARIDGYKWGWIDTCCIDKSSSTELSEAINSMYRWYQQAAVCYVYLSDVKIPQIDSSASESAIQKRQDKLWEEIIRSSWFTRGWTLQELLAPQFVEFYSCTWSNIGTKMSLSGLIEAKTGIDSSVLRGVKDLGQCPVAERLGWASGRQTHRDEDIAYCLLGIFAVNMPLLYGEGSERAFRRLQEEILRRQEDYTLLMWCSKIEPDRQAAVLARHPSSFQRLAVMLPSINGPNNQGTNQGQASPPSVDVNWSDVVPYWDSHRDRWQPDQFEPPTITSRGIRIRMMIKTRRQDEYGSEILAFTFYVSARRNCSFLCVSLFMPAQTLGIARTAMRARCDRLEAVDSLDGFEWSDLYLSLSSDIAKSFLEWPLASRSDLYRRLRSISLQLHLQHPSSIKMTFSLYPNSLEHRTISADKEQYYIDLQYYDEFEIHYSGTSIQLGAIALTIDEPACAEKIAGDGEKQSVFLVTFGITDAGSQLYCDIAAMSPQSGAKEPEKLYEKLAVLATNDSELSDRVCRPLDGRKLLWTVIKKARMVDGDQVNAIIHIAVLDEPSK